MAEIIVIGRKFTEAGPVSVNLYTGNDGLAAHQAAEEAADSHEYYFIGRLLNPAHYQPLRLRSNNPDHVPAAQVTKEPLSEVPEKLEFIPIPPPDPTVVEMLKPFSSASIPGPADAHVVQPAEEKSATQPPVPLAASGEEGRGEEATALPVTPESNEQPSEPVEETSSPAKPKPARKEKRNR